MKLLKQYFDLQQQIYDYFGCEDDECLPLEDATEVYWFVTPDRVAWSVEPITKDLVEIGVELYDGELFTFSLQSVYRTEDYTMIAVITSVDNQEVMMVFDNAKECKDEELKELFVKSW